MEFRLAMEYDKKKDTYTCKRCPYYGKCYKGIYTKTIQVCETFLFFFWKYKGSCLIVLRQLLPLGGAYEDRTHDLQIANLALSQLS